MTIYHGLWSALFLSNANTLTRCTRFELASAPCPTSSGLRLPLALCQAGVCAVQREKDSMYGLTLIWALAAVYGQQEAPIIRISTLVRRTCHEGTAVDAAVSVCDMQS